MALELELVLQSRGIWSRSVRLRGFITAGLRQQGAESKNRKSRAISIRDSLWSKREPLYLTGCFVVAAAGHQLPPPRTVIGISTLAKSPVVDHLAGESLPPLNR